MFSIQNASVVTNILFIGNKDDILGLLLNVHNNITISLSIVTICIYYETCMYSLHLHS